MSRLRQVSELVAVLAKPGGLHAFAGWKPFSLTAFRIMSRLKRQGLSFNTIIDGGANVGQFARAATETYPNARIFSIEALPDVADVLGRNLSDRSQVQVFQTALGRTSGETTFFRNEYTLASSALPLHPNQQESFPAATRTSTLSVPMSTLDVLLANEELKPPVLLKLDLQ
jgi:FkbM family methyltransferase